MVAEPIQNHQPLTSETVQRWVATYVKQGDSSWQAAARVLHDICDSGLAEDLLKLLGPAPIYSLWAATQPRTGAKVAAAPTPITPPTRRVDTAQLQDSASLLEGLQKVGDSWVRVGDLTGVQCRTVARQLKSQAMEVAHNARYYHALGQALGEKEQVRQRFSEADLIRLYDEAGRS